MFRAAIAIVALSSALLLTACPKECTPKTARCLSNTTQICRPDGKWQNVVDCNKVDKVPWACGCTDAQTCRCKKPK